MDKMGSEKSNNGKHLSRRFTASVVILLLAGAFLFYAPGFFEKKLNADTYRQWMTPKKEPSVSIINIWHIVDFKPYVGSMGAWLTDKAMKVSDKYNNIHFSVNSYSMEDAQAQLSRGNYPDVISFCGDALSSSELLPFSLPEEPANRSKDAKNEVYALPYCASGYLLIYAQNSDTEFEGTLANAGTVDDFRKGKCQSCITDIRGAGDLYRATLIGKCPYFDAKPIKGERELVQYIGLYRSIDEKKLPYALDFIDYLETDGVQSSLSGLGLLPISKTAKTSYEQPWLEALKVQFDPDEINPLF